MQEPTTVYPYSATIDGPLDEGILQDIAEEALQAFFTVVCKRLDDYYPDTPTTGDEDPGESIDRARIARRWIDSHALNNDTIARATELHERAEARAEARAYVPPAGGMTSEEAEDAYADDPAKLIAMREELDR